MPSQYRLTVDESGYHFRTDSGIKYTAFFTNYSLYDSDGNDHIVYSFGFERDGSYAAKKFKFRYDYKIKNTIIKLIGDFFDRHGENALLYFCYPDDAYARHRSITFARWCYEADCDIEHKCGSVNYEDRPLYGGIPVKKMNPLKSLLMDSFEKHMKEQFGY
ncbi:DUF6169 family protein [Pedobacter deserti]|uniref:DUF6169 family protein n=1 Tax=Pedobacter deserti TaxID=2817382 RepID=UPI00351E2B16